MFGVVHNVILSAYSLRRALDSVTLLSLLPSWFTVFSLVHIIPSADCNCFELTN
jgi:hypothetical protein